MEPLVEDWAKTAPPDVVLKQVPIAFNAGMKPLQQLYFTLIALERPDLHAKVFTAIHGEHKRLIDKKAMGEWAAAQGVDRAKFDSVFDSFSVQTQVQRANQLADAYRIEGTPSFAVGGKFMTSPVMAGNSYEGALKEVTRLIPTARAATERARLRPTGRGKTKCPRNPGAFSWAPFTRARFQTGPISPDPAPAPDPRSRPRSIPGRCAAAPARSGPRPNNGAWTGPGETSCTRLS